jgi:hypothetical protein
VCEGERERYDYDARRWEGVRRLNNLDMVMFLRECCDASITAAFWVLLAGLEREVQGTAFSAMVQRAVLLMVSFCDCHAL